MGPTDRIVVLIDMDCFFCQVEETYDPSLKGHPVGVVQYNQWGGGSLIAVNYAARDQGVKRGMRSKEARLKCPNIKLPVVPDLRGKADTTRYREAGEKVADVLANFTTLLQRASVDEAYLDITEAVECRIQAGLDDLNVETLSNTFVVGYANRLNNFIENSILNKDFIEANLKLAVGALITEEMRYAVYEKTGYECSAGVAHNKILAKLVAGLNKPNKQTVLPHESVLELYQTIPIKKITGLGGKLGDSICAEFNITLMSELSKLSEKDIARKYDEKQTTWLLNLAKGIENEPVTTKLISKSIGCCKNFPGRNCLTTKEGVEEWLLKLSEELTERLIKDLQNNERKAKQMVVGWVQEINQLDVNSSKTILLPSCSIVSYQASKIAQVAFNVIKKNCLHMDGSYCIKYMSFNVCNFESLKNVRTIESFFQSKPELHAMQTQQNNEQLIEENVYFQETLPTDVNCEELIFYDDGGNRFDNSSDTKKTPASFFANYFKSDANNKIEITNDNKDEIEETCSDCQKQIKQSEMQLHRDYHFAIDIMKSEKTSTTRIQTNKEKHVTNITHKIKKKSQINNTVLMSFIHQNNTDNEDLTEECVDCKKRFRTDEYSSHLDYHAAKKLHLELNSVERKVPPPVTLPKNKKHKKNNKPCSTLTSYFKPM